MSASDILQNLIQKFSTENLIQLFRYKTRTFREINEEATNYDNDFFSNGLLLGEIKLDNENELIAYTFKTNKELTERSGKKAQYELAKKILKQEQRYSAGFFIFYDDNYNFRFSLIYDVPQPNGKREWSNFRRFTYYVSKDQTNKTFLYRLDAADFTSLEKIKEAFSVEKVTKEFYTEIANWYFWALDVVEFPDDEDKIKEQRNAKNLIRLITRIIFVWFMKEKKLVPPSLFDKQFINQILNYSDKTGSTYYKAIIQNLFFATLNTHMKKDNKDSRIFVEDADKSGFKSESYLQQGYYRYNRFIKDKKLFLEQFENIPFLNGGLFECLDKKIDGKEIRIDCFSNNPLNETRLKVPDKLFFLEKETEVDLTKHISSGRNKKVRGLLTILKSYNFTIDENTPVDEEVALDPELLGKVFENLLASYNPETATTARKATGSYYTPREIVEYMVNESLVAYLKTKLEDESSETEERIRLLFDYNKDENPFLNQPETTLKIIDAIENVKILDPACGSGAFPMGILHKLVLVLHKLDPQNNIWKKRLLDRVPAEIRDETERSLENKSLDYIRKLGLIEHCIYGVDIQEIAIQISKLRFFISLLVEQQIDDTKPNRDVRSLPNLETKFVAANTLIGLKKPAQLGMGKETEELEGQLFKLREEIFYTNSRWEKLELQKKEKQSREKLRALLNKSGFVNEVAERISTWDPFDQNVHADWFDPEWMFGPDAKEGFDIIIANPPYITIALGKKQKFFTEETIKNFKDIYKNVFEYKGNTFSLFFAKSIFLLNKKSILTFITPNTLLLNPTFSKTREFILKHSNIEFLLNITDKVFEEAEIGGNLITILSRSNNGDHIIRFKEIDDLNDFTNNFSYNLIKQETFRTTKDFKFNLDQSSEILFDKIYFNTIPLGKVVKFYQGIITGDNKKYLSKEKINDKYCKILRGRDINKYYYVFDETYVLFDTNKLWSNTNEEYFHFIPKLINRQTGDSLIAAYDDKGFFTLDSTHIQLPINNEFDLRYVLSLFNSKLLNFFYNHSVREQGRTFAQVKTINLKPLPIKIISKDDQKIYSNIVDKILKAKQHNPQTNTQHLEDQIDIMVYKLYNLTYEEVKIIDPEIEKIISKDDYEKFENK